MTAVRAKSTLRQGKVWKPGTIKRTYTVDFCFIGQETALVHLIHNPIPTHTETGMSSVMMDRSRNIYASSVTGQERTLLTMSWIRARKSGF